MQMRQWNLFCGFKQDYCLVSGGWHKITGSCCFLHWIALPEELDTAMPNQLQGSLEGFTNKVNQ